MATEPQRYQPAPAPKLENSREAYLERELNRLQEVLNTMADAIEELQRQ